MYLECATQTRKHKIALGAIALFVGACLALGLASCQESSSSNSSDTSPSGDISVYSREDGSGTRGAFVELFGVEENKTDNTTQSAIITNSTSVMMTSVAGDENGIGYISLGSLNNTVKALEIDGVSASAAHVKDGTYKISRPFNIATKADLSEVAQDFIAYIQSDDGQKIVEDNGYISSSSTGAYASKNLSGKIVVAGSSSVTPLMEKLAEAYKALNSGVAIEVQQSDSTTGMNMASEGSCDIGMASRELKDSEKQKGLTDTVIALDGIAVIVNTQASIDGLTSDQVKSIYTGESTKWEEVLG